MRFGRINVTSGLKTELIELFKTISHLTRVCADAVNRIFREMFNRQNVQLLGKSVRAVDVHLNFFKMDRSPFLLPDESRSFEIENALQFLFEIADFFRFVSHCCTGRFASCRVCLVSNAGDVA